MLGAAPSEKSRTMPFPGSAMLVKRSAVIQAKGFTAGPMELFLRLHGQGMASGKPSRMLFLPEPVSKGRVPRTRAGLKKAVDRDQQEFAGAFSHRVELAGPFGWTLLQDLFYMRVAMPLLEVAAYSWQSSAWPLAGSISSLSFWC